MKKINAIVLVIMLLASAGALFSSCSGDDTSDDYRNQMSDIFQNLKDSYAGYLTIPNNSTKEFKVRVGDDASDGAVTTKIKVDDFPMEMIYARLYPNDWIRVTSDNAVKYEAPIDSVGFQTSFMNFKTNNDLTAQTEFGFKDSKGVHHSGWAKISTVGMFFSSLGTMNLEFNVIDLVVDNADRTSLLPLSFSVTVQKESATTSTE